jgi:outer membrane receptor protein involved in Fe transport
VEYGHLPDLDMEFSLSGPVPVIGRFLGNMTFILSVRDNKESYVFPTIQDYYHVRNINAKITSYLGLATKLNLEVLRQDENSIIDEWSGLVGPDNWYDANIYASTPGEADRTGFGIGIDHTVNNRTFWQLRISGLKANIFTDGPHTFRLSANEETFEDSVIRYFEHYGVTEAPFGFSRFPDRMSAIGSNNNVSGVGGAARNDSRISTWSARFDYTSQINRANEIKAGLFFNIDDVNAKWRWEEFDITGNESLSFKANPYRGAAYIQDKIEFQGMVANIGLRMEFTNPNLEWYKLDVDSLRYSKYFSAAYKNELDEKMPKEQVKGKVMLSPRIGISHPLTQTSKIYFNYGHDYSMPPTMDMYYVNYSRPGSPIWEIGNPNLDLPRTIRYELGFDQELFGQFLISLVAYYRDISDEVASVQYINTSESSNYSMTQNNHYADIRGFEFTLEKRWGRLWTGFINYTYLSTKEGEHGRAEQYEDPAMQRRYGFRNPFQEKPLPAPYINANLRFMTPESFGPLLGAWSVSTNFYWAKGEPMTWEPWPDPDGEFRAYNNVRWRDEINFDMRIDKRIDVGGIGLRLYADIYNIFNIQRLTGEGFRDGTDEKNYFNSLHLEEYKKEKYESNRRYEGGDDRPGDYWTKDKDYIDMPNIDLERFTPPRSITMALEFEF